VKDKYIYILCTLRDLTISTNVIIM